ncbi:MAG: DUF4835 family protein [Flavobacterium sp.]|nr:MAG: DUF4835 family protein [Flavobacterium sp.]
MRKILAFLITFWFGTVCAQQLNCTVTVNSATIANANPQTFRTLENSISEFVNKTDWTGEVYKQGERINCSMYITLSSYNTDQYVATIQVQSARPVFNSTYSTPIMNFMDKDFSFKYVEFENLVFNPTSFDSNLVSVLSYYSFMILGMDADTFSPMGGTGFFEIAQEIVNVAQQGGYKGWSQSDGNQNRYFFVNDMLSNTYSPFREAMYQYHYEGLDNMSRDLKTAKENIKASLTTLAQVHSVRPNAFLTRIFFDAKSDELVSIFSGGPAVPIADLVDNLNRISPLNSTKWSNMKM